MPNVKSCPECHHPPSVRLKIVRHGPDVPDGQELCHCKCHDVADAAPELLAACKAVDDGANWDGLATLSPAVFGLIREAIARAEGPHA